MFNWTPNQKNLSTNVHKSKNIEEKFEFAFAYLTNDNPLLLFVLKKKNVRTNARTFAASYDFVLGLMGFQQIAIVFSDGLIVVGTF